MVVITAVRLRGDTRGQLFCSQLSLQPDTPAAFRGFSGQGDIIPPSRGAH